MEFLKNNYKILYEKSKAGYASKKLPWDETNSKVTLCVGGDVSKEVHLADYKLIYEKNGLIYGSLERFPTDEDDQISGLDEAGEAVFGESVTPPPPAEDPIVKLTTTVQPRPTDLINFGVPIIPGTKNVELKIHNIADGTYIVTAKDAKDNICEISYEKDIEMGPIYSCSITIVEMPDTDVTINFEIQ